MKITLEDMMMEADAPKPLLQEVPLPPRGLSRRLSIPVFQDTEPAPPCRGPEAGSPPHIQYFHDFDRSGVNRLRSCPFLQSRKFPFFKVTAYETENRFRFFPG
jgi:hypothetical protein